MATSVPMVIVKKAAIGEQRVVPSRGESQVELCKHGASCDACNFESKTSADCAPKKAHAKQKTFAGLFWPRGKPQRVS